MSRSSSVEPSWFWKSPSLPENASSGFDLDFIWVGPGCTVVDLHQNVPAPTGPDDPMPTYRPSTETAGVIEIAAGGVYALGIERGDGVRYSPSRSGFKYGCEG